MKKKAAGDLVIPELADLAGGQMERSKQHVYHLKGSLLETIEAVNGKTVCCTYRDDICSCLRITLIQHSSQ